jgi:hypothetical protein
MKRGGGVESVADRPQQGAVQFHLSLLNRFELRHGTKVTCLARASQRLIAFLVLQNRLVAIERVAGVLWPDETDDRARACLRSALWRLPQPEGQRLVDVSPAGVWIGEGLFVDAREALGRASRLVNQGDECAPDDFDPPAFQADLLPGWYEDWVSLVE